MGRRIVNARLACTFFVVTVLLFVVLGLRVSYSESGKASRYKEISETEARVKELKLDLPKLPRDSLARDLTIELPIDPRAMWRKKYRKR